VSTVGVFDYEASAEEYRRRQAEREARMRAESGDAPTPERERLPRQRVRPASPPPPEPPPVPEPPPPAVREAPPAAPWTREPAPGVLPEALSEREGAALLEQLSERFGWSVAAIGRGTLERVLGRRLSADEWRRVRASRWWTGGVPDAMREGGTELLPTVLGSLGITPEGDDEPG
jgi:hypothetical protein